MLDEVHEASVELEFLLLAVKEVLTYNKDKWTDSTLKVVLMSATADVVKLRKYFSEVVAGEHIRHLKVPGSAFPLLGAIFNKCFDTLNIPLGISSKE